MDREQLLWNHYQQLSDEIRSADSLNYQVIGFVVAAVVALINAAFGKQSYEDRCWILLTVYAVTVPGRFLLRVARTRIWRIASYLELFVEPHLGGGGVKWQERLNTRGPRTHIIRTEFGLICGLDLVTGALVLATTSYMIDPTRIRFATGAILLMVSSAVLTVIACRQFDRGGIEHKRSRAGWSDLLKQEQLAASTQEPPPSNHVAVGSATATAPTTASPGGRLST